MKTARQAIAAARRRVLNEASAYGFQAVPANGTLFDRAGIAVDQYRLPGTDRLFCFHGKARWVVCRASTCRRTTIQELRENALRLLGKEIADAMFPEESV